MSFFTSKLNILDCNLEIPERSRWHGHTFYMMPLFHMLKILENRPRTVEATLSTPLWFIKLIGSTFDINLSKSGYNYISDITQRKLNVVMSDPSELLNVNKALVLKDKLHTQIRNLIMKNVDKTVVLYRFQSINFKNTDELIQNMSTKEFYDLLVADKVRLPKGLLKLVYGAGAFG